MKQIENPRRASFCNIPALTRGRAAGGRSGPIWTSAQARTPVERRQAPGQRERIAEVFERWAPLLEIDFLEEGFGDSFDYHHDPTPEPWQIDNVSSLYYGVIDPFAD